MFPQPHTCIFTLKSFRFLCLLLASLGEFQFFLMDLLPNRSIPIFTQSMYLRAFYPMRAEMVFNAQRLYVLNMKNYLWLVLLIQIIFTGCMQSVCIGTSILFYSFSTFLLLSILVCCIFFVSHGIYALSRRYVCIWC